jgi:tetratricopeptide (TPR) repeat protein
MSRQHRTKVPHKVGQREQKIPPLEQNWTSIGAGVFLIVLIVAAYWPALRGGFIWDDDVHLTANPCIVGPLGFGAIWTTSSAVYYPLVLTSFWIQHAVWGLNPLFYHIINVLMHAMGAVVLWRGLLALKVPGAIFGAALWAVHPVQVESVAWITELKNTQSGFFYLLAILCFLKWRGAANDREARFEGLGYGLAILFAVLAVLSKASTVMLPVVLGLCWWWKDRNWRWRNTVWLLPFLIVSIAVSAWTVWEQKFHSGALGEEWAQTPIERVAIAGKAIWFYVGKLLWPHPLIFVYPRWKLDFSEPISFLPAVAALGVGTILWVGRKDRRLGAIFFAFGYFVVSLFPVLGFFNVYFFRYSFVGDHFQYLASMGLIALAPAGLSRLPRPMQLVPVLLLGVFAIMTWQQTKIYHDQETLWGDTLAKNPTAWMAHSNLGIVLADQRKLTEAISHYEEAIHFKPDYAEAYNNLGIALALQGKFSESIQNCERAVQLKPDYADAEYNLGIALAARGNLAEAIQHYERAIQLKSGYPKIYNNLGVALFRQGKFAEAIQQFERALQLKPDFAEADHNLGVTLAAEGKVPEAIHYYEEAVRLKPDYAEAEYNLAIALSVQEKLPEAAEHYERALQLKPNYVEAMNNLAYLLATTRDPALRNGARAVALAELANRLTGTQNPVVLGTLAAVYAEAGRYREAVETASRAVERASSEGNCNLQTSLESQLRSYRAMALPEAK